MRIKQLVKLLESNGFQVVRCKGSHRTMRHPDGRSVLVTGIPPHEPSRHVVKDILRHAGVPWNQ